MEDKLKTEQQMVRYLLGDMSIDEQIAMETGYFADPEKFNLLQVVEHDLIEGYINNKLSATGRARFEHHFLSTPARREHVRFFQTLTKIIPFEFDQPIQEPEAVRAAVPESIDIGPKVSWWETIMAPFRLNKLAVGMSFAAAIMVLAAAGAWILIGNRQQSNRNLANLEPTPSQTQIANPDQPKQANPDKTNTNNDIKRDDTPSSLPDATKPVKPVVASFVLTIPGFRGEDPSKSNTSQVLRIPASAESVRLTFNHPDVPYKRYKVSLQTLDGKNVWSRTEVKAGRVKSGTSLMLNVPAKQFNEGTYILTLSRNNTEGEWVVFHDFYIEIVR